MQNILRIMLIAFLAIGGNYVLWGQGTTTSSMNGRVVAKDGAPLASATVTAVHEPTGSIYGALTNDEGYFRIVNMRVGGPYKVSSSYVGYEEAAETGIFLTLGQTFRVNLEMDEGEVVLDEVLITSTSGAIFDGNRTGRRDLCE